MNRSYICDGLYLHYDSARYYDVGSVSTIQLGAAIDDRYRFLSVKRQSPETQLVAKAFLVDSLEQARTELPVDSNGRSNNFVGELFVGHKKSLTQRHRAKNAK